jgi:23S rRNA-/tRNA-specific pseudouridylate synthase
MEASPRILFENEDFVALDKPAGWLSVPARHPTPSDLVVSDWLRQGPLGSAYVIHRLDRFTSGVMLVARNPASHRQGSLWFQNRVAKKIYRFLASPVPSRPAIQIRTPVDGKPAQTLFEVMESASGVFLGQATPLTGRFHQIREHAAEAGFPLLGDKPFGGRPSDRVCLHAFSLETPVGKFEAPLAPDLVTLWEHLKHA